MDDWGNPQWLRTGYKYFPYAAMHAGKWWALRVNYGFPEHDLYTLFIDGEYIADLTGDIASHNPFVASIGALSFAPARTDEPALDPATAAPVIAAVALYVNYGSERNDPCIFCSDDDRDGMTAS